ncbi:phenylacetic acid degradation bifunctional protein PaaZ [uncultured Thiothrix sp.]|uniref:phenylacetic acid degradation bifunctional protein PaaZ n=1 Tax=uncultured Thiothrix sp. TaxID=223185 RepID=UPI002629452C|nr:phenylacetic acid degradation bifunctional protein PaaZ [uncultured Thiothrix sp.]HMT92488.1 phenylacetic acid degradation bifunctional protein PaaZ [Thiolinea sp.]
MKLQSYAQGEWYASSTAGALIKHAITGEDFAEISSDGLDFQAMLDYARKVGGSNLRKYTFHQRALMLKALGKYLIERKEQLYTCSKATGATRTDSWIDIEGGISTMLVFASKGRRELPNSNIYLDGAQEQISRHGTFTAQHIYTPITGVAVQINAFNFPCWGMLEKLAPTLLAGVPTIVKPASQTAYVTELVVKMIIESKILPEGVLQLVCGSTGNLLDHLTCQDAVSFTGSAWTGQKLKQHPNVIANSVRFYMEADSLNCSILGSDVQPGTPSFDLYIKEVVREMTVKAGQKCTAIRRSIVPADRLEAVAAALKERLSKIQVGDPDQEGVKMGALAGLEQRSDVRERIAELAKQNEVLFGDMHQVDVLGANNDTGAFLSPMVLACKDARTTNAHDVEAFGPVTTLIPYSSDEEAVELAALGKGSLVASVATANKEVARKIVVGIAPYHGRVLVLDEKCAKESTGHGSPLAHLIHGGPGRAGGSEEMGGVRGVKHYMQRTAVQGSPDMLTAVTGVWMQGAERNTDGIHPFRKTFDELEVGDAVITEKRTLSLADIEAFAELSGDKFYAHMDQAAAQRNPFFKDRVAHGYFLVSLAAGLFVEPNEGPVLANYGLDDLRFSAPVYAGDTLQVQFTCKQKTNRETENYGEVRWDTAIVNQEGALVAHYDVLTLVAKQQGGETK